MNAARFADSGAPRRPEGPSCLIIDDHPLFCEALALALTAELGAATRIVHSLSEAVALLEGGYEADAAILDLNLPDVQGFEGLLRLKARFARLPVMVISGLDDSRIVTGAIQAGAAGFAPKNAPRERIVESLRRVLAGDLALPPGYGPAAAAEAPPDAEAVARLKDLTAQQLRILELVCAGKLNKQIAYDLSIAETTVKAHITAILRKLGVHSRTQAVLVAREARYSEILRS